jgi:plasmid stabilization system protein ParE
LREFLAIQSPGAASRAVQAIRAGLRTVKTAPGADRPIPWLPEEYRELIVPFGHGGYVILYRAREDEVVIQALRHGKEEGYLR